MADNESLGQVSGNSHVLTIKTKLDETSWAAIENKLKGIADVFTKVTSGGSSGASSGLVRRIDQYSKSQQKQSDESTKSAKQQYKALVDQLNAYEKLSGKLKVMRSLYKAAGDEAKGIVHPLKTIREMLGQPLSKNMATDLLKKLATDTDTAIMKLKELSSVQAHLAQKKTTTKKVEADDKLADWKEEVEKQKAISKINVEMERFRELSKLAGEEAAKISTPFKYLHAEVSEVSTLLDKMSSQQLKVFNTHLKQSSDQMLNLPKVQDALKAPVDPGVAYMADVKRRQELYAINIKLEEMNRLYAIAGNQAASIISPLKRNQLELDNINVKLEKMTALQRKAFSEDIGLTNQQLRGLGSVQEALSSGGGEIHGFMARFSKITQWMTSVWALFALLRGVKAGVRTIVEFESKMIELQKVMVGTEKDFRDLEKAAFDLGRTMGRSAIEAADAMVLFAKQGRTAMEVQELTKVALMTANVGDIGIGDAVKYFTAATKQYKMAATEVMIILDSWNEVSNKNAITLADLGEGLSATGTAARLVGIDIHQLNGILTALVAATGKSGNEIGNMLKFMFRRATMDQALAAFKQLGIQVVDITTGTFRNLSEVFDELMLQWKDLSDAERNMVTSALGGRRHQEVLTLFEEWDSVIKATNDSLNSAGSAYRENEKYMRSLERRIQTLKTGAQQLSKSFGDAGIVTVLNGLIAAGNSMLNIFIKLPEAIKAASVALGAFLGIAKFLGVLTLSPWVLGIGALVTGLGAVTGVMETFRGKTRDTTVEMYTQLEVTQSLVRNMEKLRAEYDEMSGQLAEGNVSGLQEKLLIDAHGYLESVLGLGEMLKQAEDQKTQELIAELKQRVEQQGKAFAEVQGIVAFFAGGLEGPRLELSGNLYYDDAMQQAYDYFKKMATSVGLDDRSPVNKLIDIAKNMFGIPTKDAIDKMLSDDQVFVEVVQKFYEHYKSLLSDYQSSIFELMRLGATDIDHLLEILPQELREAMSLEVERAEFWGWLDLLKTRIDELGDQYKNAKSMLDNAFKVGKLSVQEYTMELVRLEQKDPFRKHLESLLELNEELRTGTKSAIEDAFRDLFQGQDWVESLRESLLKLEQDMFARMATEWITGSAYMQMDLARKFAGMGALFGAPTTTDKTIDYVDILRLDEEGNLFSSGGFTGVGGKYEPAGIVHKGEYVLSDWMVKKNPALVALLEQMRVRGYASGGSVGTSVASQIKVAWIEDIYGLLRQWLPTLEIFQKIDEKFDKFFGDIGQSLSKLSGMPTEIINTVVSGIGQQIADDSNLGDLGRTLLSSVNAIAGRNAQGQASSFWKPLMGAAITTFGVKPDLIKSGWDWLRGALGFASGGYTGSGPTNRIAGVVHGGEWVMPDWMVNHYPSLVSMLEEMRVKGYQSGGLVTNSLVSGTVNTWHDNLMIGSFSKLTGTMEKLMVGINSLADQFEIYRMPSGGSLWGFSQEYDIPMGLVRRWNSDLPSNDRLVQSGHPLQYAPNWRDYVPKDEETYRMIEESQREEFLAKLSKLPISQNDMRALALMAELEAGGETPDSIVKWGDMEAPEGLLAVVGSMFNRMLSKDFVNELSQQVIDEHGLVYAMLSHPNAYQPYQSWRELMESGSAPSVASMNAVNMVLGSGMDLSYGAETFYNPTTSDPNRVQEIHAQPGVVTRQVGGHVFFSQSPYLTSTIQPGQRLSEKYFDIETNNIERALYNLAVAIDDATRNINESSSDFAFQPVAGGTGEVARQTVRLDDEAMQALTARVPTNLESFLKFFEEDFSLENIWGSVDDILATALEGRDGGDLMQLLVGDPKAALQQLGIDAVMRDAAEVFKHSPELMDQAFNRILDQLDIVRDVDDEVYQFLYKSFYDKKDYDNIVDAFRDEEKWQDIVSAGVMQLAKTGSPAAAFIGAMGGAITGTSLEDQWAERVKGWVGEDVKVTDFFAGMSGIVGAVQMGAEDPRYWSSLLGGVGSMWYGPAGGFLGNVLGSFFGGRKQEEQAEQLRWGKQIVTPDFFSLDERFYMSGRHAALLEAERGTVINTGDIIINGVQDGREAADQFINRVGAHFYRGINPVR